MDFFKRKDRDFTRLPIGGGVLALAVPMITGSILQSVQSLVDMFFVGRLGPASVAAVGMAGTAMMLVATAFIGIHSATVAMVSRAIGEEDDAKASHVAGQAIVLTAVTAGAIMLAGVWLSAALMDWLGAAPEVARLGEEYLRILFGGVFFLIAFFVLSAILQGAGDAVTPLRLGIITTVANVILNPIFIFGFLGVPALGVKGSALATVLARAIAFVIGGWVLLGGRVRVRLHLRNLVPDPATLRRLLRLALPGAMQLMTRTVMNLILMVVVAQFGTAVVAAYTVGLRVRMLGLFPAFGFGGAAATMVGQNLGAKQPERSRKSAWAAAGMAMAVCGTAGLACFLFATPLVRIFNTDPVVVETGTAFLRITALGLLTSPLGIVLSRSLNGAGDPISPLVISFLALWGFQIPVAIWLSGVETVWGMAVPLRETFAPLAVGDQTGIWYAMIAASILQASLTAAWFATGRWQRATV